MNSTHKHTQTVQVTVNNGGTSAAEIAVGIFVGFFVIPTTVLLAFFGIVMVDTGYWRLPEPPSGLPTVTVTWPE
jgi:hypothetical protein